MIVLTQGKKCKTEEEGKKIFCKECGNFFSGTSLYYFFNNKKKLIQNFKVVNYIFRKKSENMKIQKRKRRHAVRKEENDVEAISHFPFPNPPRRDACFSPAPSDGEGSSHVYPRRAEGISRPLNQYTTPIYCFSLTEEPSCDENILKQSLFVLWFLLLPVS